MHQLLFFFFQNLSPSLFTQGEGEMPFLLISNSFPYQSMDHRSVHSGQVGSVIGFALGGVSVFVIVVVAVIMVIRRRSNPQFVSHSYVEVSFPGLQ